MEKEFIVFKLQFTSALHISKGRSDYDNSDSLLHSDAISAALYVAGHSLYSDDEVSSIFGDTVFSSAFPFFDDEFFFPKPFVRLPDFEKSDKISDAKKYKKISWLSSFHFENLINDTGREWRKEDVVGGGAFISNHSKSFGKKDFWKKEIQQRVQIPMNSYGDTLPYYVERIRFNENGGLYFMVRGNEQSIEKIARCLDWLGDQGIGTDKSVGNGQFKVMRDKINLKLPDSDYGVLLSLYCPAKEERSTGFLTNARYNLVKRGGYLVSPQDENNMTRHKKSVYMFSEGSIFNDFSNRKGSLIDLNPSEEFVKHPVWRDGRAFFLPLKFQD